MIGLFVKLVLALLLVGWWRKLRAIPEQESTAKRGRGQEDDEGFRGALKAILTSGLFRAAVLAVAVLIAGYAVMGTSVVWVKSGHFATLKKVYLGKSLPPGRIVALDGELGPQASILTPGFHMIPFVTILNEVDQVPIFSVPNGKCALISARDGIPVSGGSAFAEPWPDDKKQRMVNDATYFLMEGKGQRGPQTTVLTPGSYMINPFLWEEPRLILATRVEQGMVGVVKSSIRAAVDFGDLKRPMPLTNELKVLTANRLPKDSAKALVVPVGGVGVWEEVLANGLYYINTDAYRITMMPTTAQVYEYKGGYKHRTVEVSVNDKGQIVERVNETEVKLTPASADAAIFTKPEGWDVAQELRVIAQVSPEMAPFVVATLGVTEANSAQVIEDRVVTPIIRSVVRDVLGGAQIPFKTQRAALDKTGLPLVENGEPKIETVSEFRSVKVMDLLENRSSLEEHIESIVKPEALKEGVSIMEIRLSESAIPAELLIARKREQLAQQLTKAWAQEEIAQRQRQLTENARAQAEQQSELVKAEIAAKAAKERANARMIEGEGEQKYLTAIAAGQEAQSKVLGQEMTARLQMFQQVLKTFDGIVEKSPNIIIEALKGAHKFVPEVVVNGGGGLEGAAAIFGRSFNKSGSKSTPVTSN